MKTCLSTTFLLLIILIVNSQQYYTNDSYLKNYSEIIPFHKTITLEIVPEDQNYSSYITNKSFTQSIVGTTEYDLQSNASADHRIRYNSDGTISTVWTMGSGNFTNRGTGYNYNNGTAWASHPTSRIETIRTGWPSYAPLGVGEIVISHASGSLIMSKRTLKGSGTWIESTIPSPVGASPTWARAITVDDTIHVLANSYDTYQGMRQALIYMRSTNGGTTWTNTIPAGMTSFNYATINGDVYSWAEPKNGVLAFVVGDKWHDVFLMKSTDGGSTWTKTVIFSHPEPHPMWNVPPIDCDTLYVCDGALAVDLDNSGNAHVAFGIQRVMYRVVDDPLNNGQFSFFPATDGIAYWREGEPPLTYLNPAHLSATGKLVAWGQDVDNSGFFLDNLIFIDQIPKYYLSISSMPQLHIDNNNDIYLVYVSLNETLSLMDQFYNHVWGRKSTNGGNTWSGFTEITHGILYEYSECVFPSLSKTSNNFLHILTQIDEMPGMHVRGNLHPLTLNEITYIRVLKSDIGGATVDIDNITNFSVDIFPNPANDFIYISVTLPNQSVAKLKVSNILGQCFHEESLAFHYGENIKHLQLSDYPMGVYIVSVCVENKTVTKKLILE